MAAANSKGYKPPAEFVNITRDPLADLDLGGSKELWLIQWPMNQNPGFTGQEVTLDLDCEGKLGSFEGSSGKVYDLVSHSALGTDAVVFQPSSSGAIIDGEISRRVSLVRYPEPDEFVKDKRSSSYLRSSMTSSKMTSSFATPTRSMMSRGDRSLENKSGTCSRSGKHSGKSGLSEEKGEPSSSKLFSSSSKRRVESSGHYSSGTAKKSKSRSKN